MSAASAASADFCSTLSVCLEFWLLGGLSFESRVPSGRRGYAETISHALGKAMDKRFGQVVLLYSKLSNYSLQVYGLACVFLFPNV